MIIQIAFFTTTIIIIFFHIRSASILSVLKWEKISIEQFPIIKREYFQIP